MTFRPDETPAKRSLWPWLTVAIAGCVVPALALMLTRDADRVSPIVAVGMMGAGMIAAATAGRLWVGIAVALMNGAGLLLLARAIETPAAADLAAIAVAAIAASLSFAARGALFAASSGARGWWIALAIVAGEAAVLLTAAAMPGAWPGWVLALLPAQWAALALGAAWAGAPVPVAAAAMFALGGTAAATMLVTRLWPRRWPYLVMFSTWLACSALVWQRWEAAL